MMCSTLFVLQCGFYAPEMVIYWDLNSVPKLTSASSFGRCRPMGRIQIKLTTLEVPWLDHGPWRIKPSSNVAFWTVRHLISPTRFDPQQLAL